MEGVSNLIYISSLLFIDIGNNVKLANEERNIGVLRIENSFKLRSLL